MLPPKLQLLADAQAGAFTADQARRHKFDVAPHRRAGRLTVIRKQVYAVTAYAEALEPAAAAALQASARLLVSAGDLVASHATAAAIHGFRVRDGRPAEPHAHPGARGPDSVRAPQFHHRCFAGTAQVPAVRRGGDQPRTHGG